MSFQHCYWKVLEFKAGHQANYEYYPIHYSQGRSDRNSAVGRPIDSYAPWETTMAAGALNLAHTASLGAAL